MRKLLASLLALILLGSYSCAYVERSKRIDKLTVEKMKDACPNPQMAFPFEVFGTNMFVIRAEKCMGFDDLFVLGYAEDWNEFSQTLTKLMVLEFLRGHNVNPNNEDNQLGYIFLKNESDSTLSGGFVFYEFRLVKID